jgi:ubiquinone/menaquinone biosynthesis C-methylase UbiE
MTNRLDFGCAFEKHEGWLGFDLNDHGHNLVGDVLDGLPFPEYHFDMITAHHSLQMIRFDDLPRALAELRRVLKPGGALRISVPDALKAVNKYIAGVEHAFPISDEIERTADGRFWRYMFWHGDARSAFSYESLEDTLWRSRFQNVRRCEFKQTHTQHPEIVDLDGRESESLIVECTR